MLVPNIAGDKSGLISRIFQGTAPILAKGKELKKTNRPLYNIVKWTINIVILLVLLLVLSAISAVILNIFKAIS